MAATIGLTTTGATAGVAAGSVAGVAAGDAAGSASTMRLFNNDPVAGEPH